MWGLGNSSSAAKQLKFEIPWSVKFLSRHSKPHILPLFAVPLFFYRFQPQRQESAVPQIKRGHSNAAKGSRTKHA